VLLWAGADPGSVGMGARMPQAPTFADALAPDHVNDLLVLAQPAPPRPPTPSNSTTPTDAPAGSARPLDALFEGIPFASVRAILSANDGLAGILEDIRRFRQDPEAFEHALDP